MTAALRTERKGPLLVLTVAALGLWGYNASLIARGVAAPDDETAAAPPPASSAPDRPLFEPGYPDPFVPSDHSPSEVAAIGLDRGSSYASGAGSPGAYPPTAGAAWGGPPSAAYGAPVEPTREPEPAYEPDPYVPPPLSLRGVVGRRALVADPGGVVHLLAPGDTLAGATLRAVTDGAAQFTHAGDPFTLSL